MEEPDAPPADARAADPDRGLSRRDSRELAVALVSAYEGVALLANALNDPSLVATECRRLERWIDSLASETTPATR